MQDNGPPVLDLRKPALCNHHWNSVNYIFVHLCFNAFICWIFCTDEPPVHTVCPVSPSMNVHNKKKQSKMLWNLILLKKKKKKKNAIWWFKLCLHFTLMSRSSTHTLQMNNAINPSSKAPLVKSPRGCRFLSVWMRFVQSKRCSCHGLEADVAIVIAKRDKMTVY